MEEFDEDEEEEDGEPESEDDDEDEEDKEVKVDTGASGGDLPPGTKKDEDEYVYSIIQQT